LQNIISCLEAYCTFIHVTGCFHKLRWERPSIQQVTSLEGLVMEAEVMIVISSLMK